MKPEKKFKNKKEETSIPSVSLLIKSPIQVLTGPNWLDIESPFVSTFLPLDHGSTKIRQGGSQSFTTRSAILHKEVGNPSQGGRESFTRRSGVLHKEVGNPSQGGRESFTRRSGILQKEVGNPSQGGGNPLQGGGTLLQKEVEMLAK